MKPTSILIVEDEKMVRDTLRRRLVSEGYQVQEAATGAEARQLVSVASFDVVLLDYRLPDIDGITVLREIKAQSPETIAIIMTAFSSIDMAVEALRVGATDFVTKPFSPDEIVVSVQKALETQALRQEVRRIRTDAGRRFSLEALVGQTPVMQRLREQVRTIAAARGGTVLLQGPSGAGKDVVAKVIHYNSPRADKPFVNITCTAITESLLESEIFGHEKGAFTDARETKKGLFEIADGGTIFLDEIGDMPVTLQAKLLRFLEERAFRRVGGTKDLSVDVRIISATNHNVRDLVSQGKFRADLFYRLNSVPIVVPPLKDRLEDVGVLAAHFIREYNLELRRNVRGLAPEALESLRQHDWPGNVRELRNVIERAMLLGTGGEIQAADLGIEALAGAGSPGAVRDAADLLGPEGVDLEEVERRLVTEAIRRTGGNQTHAAKLLHITRDQLRYRLEKFGLLSSS